MYSVDLINHVFFPRKLPGSQDDAALLAFEKYLLNKFSTFLGAQHPKQVFGESLTKVWADDFGKVQKLYKTWNVLQGEPGPPQKGIGTPEGVKGSTVKEPPEEEIDSEITPPRPAAVFAKSIFDLLPRESIAFYVREQNSTLVITRTGELRFRMASFLTSQSNVSIFSSVGDLIAEFPGNCIEIPFSRVLHSEMFAEDILNFCCTPYLPAMKMSRKAGHEFEELREVVRPMLVTQYVTCALTSQASKNCDEHQYKRITKKIRDQVVWGNALKPFRRSGMWMSLKVILQLELVNRFGLDTGTLLYKLLLLNFLKTCCYEGCGKGQKSNDTALQIISKISRRLAKASVLLSKSGQNYISDVGVAYFHHIQIKTHEIVLSIRRNMDVTWSKVINENSATIKPIMLHNVEDSTRHQLTNFLVDETCSQVPASSKVPLPPPRTRFRVDEFMVLLQQCLLFPLDYFTSTSDEQLLGLILYDFERYIFGLPQEFLTVAKSGSCGHFFGLLEGYIGVAKKYYEKDPVGGSRMVLTSFKIVQLLDVLALTRAPLLREHNSGVKPTILHDVLMPFRRDALLLEDLETYFRVRNTKSEYTSLVEETQLTRSSFTARFTQNCPEMVKLREEILAESAKEIEAKYLELKSVRERCAKLRSEKVGSQHKYTTVTDRYGDRETIHDEYSCKKCTLERQIDACKVSKYEKPLPETIYEQNGVVFELLIPIEIACLRDALFVFSRDICRGRLTSDVSVEGRWTEAMHIIRRRHVNRHQKYIHLVSTTKATLTSHYGEPLHVDNGDANFIVNNGFQCSFGTRAKTLCYSTTQPQITAKNFCVFTVQPGSVYSDMQWTLESTKHSQNKVLATQCNCPLDLALAEYKEFGSLRVSHRLQYRNILRAIATESLSFREASVLCLICQAMWEAGPPLPQRQDSSSDLPGHFYREAHEDVSIDHHFTTELLTVLDYFLEKNRNNWNDQAILLLIILLCNRIRSMSSGNEECLNKCQDLILKCRDVALNWTCAIEKLLSTTSSERSGTGLRMKLVQVAASGALTFSAETHSPVIAPTSESLSQWLLFIAKIEDNILLTNSSLGNLAAETRNLLRWVRCVGVDLEPHFHGRSDKALALQHFTRVQWSGATNSGNSLWSHSGQWYVGHIGHELDERNSAAVLQMDIILGTFLVNGQPIGRLPRDITSHEQFQRLFSGFIFVVQTANRGGYITKDKYHDECRYRFHLTGNELLVAEMGPDGEETRLVPHDKFQGDIPILLITEFSHWRHMRKNVVQFRSKDFGSTGFRTDVKYELRLRTKTLHETIHDKPMVDINSKLFKQISKVVSRLEKQKYIHVFREPGGAPNLSTQSGHLLPVLSIELPRMGFHFYVTAEGAIMSNEYRGYKLATTQGFGTLVGLQQTLLLTCENTNPIVLIPHGTPSRDFRDVLGSQEVSICRTKLRKPPVFVFEVDETLHRLKAQPFQSGWLYLAHLHALTSCVLPDPFTGLTGAESAIQLLQSPLCWSCEPIDEEGVTTLESIKMLSPLRAFYPSHLREMETVRWPGGLPTSCAHEAFVFLVNKLLADSTRLVFAFRVPADDNSEHAEQQTRGTNLYLARRAYWKSVPIYSPQARIKSDFDSCFIWEPKCSSVSSLSLNSLPLTPTPYYDAPELRAVRLFADVGEKWAYPPKFCPELLTQTLCTTSTILAPCSFVEFQGGFNDRVKIKLVENWLGLYNYARLVVRRKMHVQWTLLLTSMAFGGCEHEYGQLGSQEKLTEHLKLLHAVAVGHEKLADLDPPKFGSFTNTNEDWFDKAWLETTVRSSMRSFGGVTRSYNESKSEFQTREWEAKAAHVQAVNEQVCLIMEYLESNFETLKKTVYLCKIKSLDTYGQISKVESVHSLNQSISQMLQRWYGNRKLKKFIKRVEVRLQLISKTNIRRREPAFYVLTQNVNTKLLSAVANRSRFNATKFWTEALQQASPLLTSSWARAVQPKANQTQRPTRVVLKTIQKPGYKQYSDRSSYLSQFPALTSTNSSSKAACPAEDEYPLRFGSTGVAQRDEILREYGTDLKKSWNEFMARRHWSGQTGTEEQLDTHTAKKVLEELKAESGELWNKMIAKIQLDNMNLSVNTLKHAGLLFRLTPGTLLPSLLPRTSQTFPEFLKNDIEEIAIVWTQEQKVRRCLRFAAAGRSMQLALSRELENMGYTNWSAREKPEWLLLQLEMDLMIRAVQVDVAEKMAKSDGPHSLLQLNMGEGKTSVIIPMLASVLATGSQLCRVTVLKSLYSTNKQMLTFSVGGLLGQRVYTFPCRRDLHLDENNVQSIQALYEECLAKQGVVMTVPEFRLSFQLKSYDMCRSFDLTTAKKLLHTNAWLRLNARDVLDECDEILNVKYQLIYTIGEQQAVGGGPNRWTTSQRVLRLLPRHLLNLRNDQLSKTGHPGIEVQYSKESDKTQNVFPHCRLLNVESYPALIKLIALDLLEGRSDVQMPEIPIPVETNRALLFKFLTEPVLSREDHEAALEMFVPTTTCAATHLNTLLTLRGLLAYGVIQHGLTRRWRVNYGVNPKGPKKMAVPFRAKDVSSERTEFGHTDVAILLTQLSYYYSGLCSDQVRDCFRFLARFEDKELQYRSWIEGVENLDPSLTSLTGVNLEDSDQTMSKTIPTLYKNSRVIDFWLSNGVYPKESKQFPYKLTCTPWDLCTTEMKHPVTGFSGTNDTKLLLPLTISQQDLPELLGTNGQVLYNLLKPENDSYSMFPVGVTGKEMLAELVRVGIPLLIDVGALMIDLSNRNVASEWLALVANDDKYKAALYFNESDEIMIVDREGRATPFNLSPYRTSLDVCLIYLDDVHTRGTDLKIPRGTKGAVTLGKGVTKDKLVQGCMRLRMLGNGHTVAYYASNEVDIEIRAIAPSKTSFGGAEVVLWALNNSCTVTRDGFHHWMSAAANFYTKTSANLMYEESSKSENDMRLLERMCREDEVLDLVDIYGSYRNEEEFHLIADRRMKSQAAGLEQLVPVNAAPLILYQFEAGTAQVVRRCRKYTKNVKRLTNMLDEEQERELENEQEEERQKERPGPAIPVEHHLAKELVQFIAGSANIVRPEVSNWCVRVPQALFNTQIWLHVQANGWGQNIYATNDFCQVVKHEVGRGVGDYIRPVTWFVSKTKGEGTTLLLLSPFEANEVKYMFTSSTAVHKGTSLHMFSPRLHPDHSTFWTTWQLTLPSSVQPFVPMHRHQLLNANLLLFSGSLFFKDEAEQQHYCNLLGFVPTPRNEAEEKAFKDGFIHAQLRLNSYRLKFIISALQLTIARLRLGLASELTRSESGTKK